MRSRYKNKIKTTSNTVTRYEDRMLMPAHWLRLIRMPILTKGSRNSLLRMLLITLLLPACSFLIFLSTISRSSFSTSYSTPRNLSRLFLASSSLSKCQRGLTHADEVVMGPPAPLHQPVGRLRGDGGGKSEQKSRRKLAVYSLLLSIRFFRIE